MVVFFLAMTGFGHALAAFTNKISEHENPRELASISFADISGETVTLNQWDGKFVILNIWATWCGPCREEMPMLDRLQAQLGGEYFQVVALSIDSGGVNPVKEFYDEVGIEHLKIYLDESMRSSGALNVIGLPTTLFINPLGQEIGRLLGPAEWDSEQMVSYIENKIQMHFNKDPDNEQ